MRPSSLLLTTTTTLLLPTLTTAQTNLSQWNIWSENWMLTWLTNNEHKTFWGSISAMYLPVMKPNGENMVNWCDYRGCWRNSGRSPKLSGVHWDTIPPSPPGYRCQTISPVLGPDRTKSSQCFSLNMDNSATMGIWASKELQCELFFDDWCQNYIMQKNYSSPSEYKRVYFDSAMLKSTTSKAGEGEWGFDNLDSSKGRWLNGAGFQKQLFRKFGPKSIRCWVDGGAVGLGVKRKRDVGGEEEREEWNAMQQRKAEEMGWDRSLEGRAGVVGAESEGVLMGVDAGWEGDTAAPGDFGEGSEDEESGQGLNAREVLDVDDDDLQDGGREEVERSDEEQEADDIVLEAQEIADVVTPKEDEQDTRPDGN